MSLGHGTDKRSQLSLGQDDQTKSTTTESPVRIKLSRTALENLGFTLPEAEDRTLDQLLFGGRGRHGDSTEQSPFPQFNDAPAGVRKILIDRVQRPASTHEELARFRGPVTGLLESAANGSVEDRGAKRINELVDLVDKFARVREAYLKELRYLRNAHYVVRFFGSTVKRREPYHETTPAIMLIAEAVGTLQDLSHALRELGDSNLTLMAGKIDKVLRRKELQPFIERTDFISAVRKGTGSYFLANISVEAQERHKRRWDLIDYDEDGSGTESQRSTEPEGNPPQQKSQIQFAELEELHRRLWHIGRDEELTEQYGRLRPQGRPEHAYLRQFMCSITESVIDKLGFISRIAKMGLEGKGIYAHPVSDPQTMSLHGFRSPVIDKKPNEVIPIDIELTPERNALLISGPNMSGKTALSQGIGLAAVMNQAGLTIPADAAALPLFRNIYTVFPSIHQMRPGFGYFTMLVSQLSALSEKVGPGDLIILDEVPTGSDYYDLVASMTVLIEDMIKSGATVIATSHIKEAFRLLQQRTGQDPQRMMCEIHDGKLKPAYRIEPGVAKHSHAIELMRETGFDEQIVALARAYYRCITEPGAVAYDDLPTPTPITNNKQDDWRQIHPDTVFEREMRRILHALYSDRNFALRDTIEKLYQFVFHGGENGDADISAIEEALTKRKDEKGDKGKAESDRLIEPKPKKDTPEEDWLAKRLETFEALTSKDAKLLSKISSALQKLDRVDNWRVQRLEPKKLAKEYREAINELRSCISGARDSIEPISDVTVAAEWQSELDRALKGLDKLQQKLDVPQAEVGEEDKKERDVSWSIYWSEISNFVRYCFREIDSRVGIARGIQENGLKRPTITNEPRHLDMKNARPYSGGDSFFSHGPFLDNGVPQNINVTPSKPILIVTGPNSSGKTVLMLNTAANSLFALNGMYVSGEMTITRFDNVHAFFGGQTLTRTGQSYFKNVLEYYSKLLKEVTPNSLVILDEVHGSDYFELAAIQLAVLHRLRERNATVLYNTHIRNGIKDASTHLGLDIYKTDFSIDNNPGQIKAQYTISPDPDLLAKSYGLLVARKHFIRDQYDRAVELRDALEAQSNL